MYKKPIIIFSTLALWLILGTGTAFGSGGGGSQAKLTPIEQLGKLIFFDKNLSIKRNQACAACHTPDTGFTGPLSHINAAGSVYEGSVRGRFGNRKPPASAYATNSPVLHYVIEEGEALFI